MYCYSSLSLSLYLKESFLFLSLGRVKDNGKIKNAKYKITFCSFLQITDGSYIYPLIIDKNMRNIYNFIHKSFLCIWHFSRHCLTHHIRSRPILRGLFQICTNYSFSSSLFLFLFYCDKLSSMLTSYILFLCTMFTLFATGKCWTSSCTFFSCTFLSF